MIPQWEKQLAYSENQKKGHISVVADWFVLLLLAGGIEEFLCLGAEKIRENERNRKESDRFGVQGRQKY